MDLVSEVSMESMSVRSEQQMTGLKDRRHSGINKESGQDIKKTKQKCWGKKKDETKCEEQ